MLSSDEVFVTVTACIFLMGEFIQSFKNFVILKVRIQASVNKEKVR